MHNAAPCRSITCAIGRYGVVVAASSCTVLLCARGKTHHVYDSIHFSKLPTGLVVSADGSLAASISSDKTAKIFDVLNFDMIAMLRLSFVPSCAEWLFKVVTALVLCCFFPFVFIFSLFVLWFPLVC